ncbi:MAG TPA: bifunctional YncE family protein/alkaline phosphatase family protein [Chitinophagaceae bacterium]|nr:bifunctional YncE family protein/alkaline phosphatase family protein [Chitinophagaceae bacterium]
MRKIIFAFCIINLSLIAAAQKPGHVDNKTVLLPNGWTVTPAGRSLPLGDLPLNIAISSSKRYIAVTNNGQSTQTLQLIDVKKEKILDNIEIARSWLGLKFSQDEKYLYASGGNNNLILKYAVSNNKLVLTDSIKLGKKWPEKISPAGIEIDDKRNLLYVVTKDNNSLYIINLTSKNIVHQYKLDAEAYTCLLSPDKKELYITCWGCDKLIVFDTEKLKVKSAIKVGDNPNDICLTKNGKYLFVANANDNSVSVIDIKKRKVIETVTSSLYPNAPPGSTTNGVALSDDEKNLYIANADNNCVAVFDVSKPGTSVSKGFIPTGWYPTCVKVIGKKILVANGKGFSSMANPKGPNPAVRRQKVVYQSGDPMPEKEQYIGGLFIGTLSIIDIPTVRQLARYSTQVYQNTPYTKTKELLSTGEEGNPIPKRIGDPSPIKYVFYIVKENRTYDQVLGDIEGGNGDTSLVLFGEKITPNHHKLAKNFVLLDNFYVNAEVSADGHNWSMGGYATDYLEKNWVTSYGGRGGTYDGEGNREVANNKGGFLWDYSKRAGVTYRTYGEFADDKKANIPVLKDHFCPSFIGWNMRVQDTLRFSQWKRDFDSLVLKNALPRLNTLRFPNDHTEGMTVGRPTPFAHVADNDLAIGRFIEHLSKSPVWKESVVFILEDDAQNGPDHVDAHRSTAYVAGPYVRRNYVDHTMYSTTSMLRTIELILGIPPMSQYDAAAEPMWRSFTSKPDLTAFTALPNNIDLSEKNTAVNELSRKSEQFNFAKVDAINDFQFNEVLWKGIKGINSPVPAPTRGAFLKVNKLDID